MKSIKQLLLDVSLILGIPAAGVGLGAGGAWLAIDIANKINSKKGEGLNLMEPGLHLTKGNHRVVITNQFWDAYIPTATELDKKITVNGLKKAYQDLNDACSNLSFELCTTVDEPAKLGIKKIDEVKSDDIPLYVKDIVCGTLDKVCSASTLARTSFNSNSFTATMKNVNITFKKSVLDVVYSSKYLDVPHNAFIYDIAVHESMHAMGFAHEEVKDSIMYPYTSAMKYNYDFLKDENYTCLTDKDKLALDKYCVRFYDAEPKYKENGGKQTVRALQKKVILEEELSF